MKSKKIKVQELLRNALINRIKPEDEIDLSQFGLEKFNDKEYNMTDDEFIAYVIRRHSDCILLYLMGYDDTPNTNLSEQVYDELVGDKK